MIGHSRRVKKDDTFINWAMINRDDEISIPFLNKESKLSYVNRRGLREYINDFTKKWEKEITMLSVKATGKTHFRVGGGNYTFFFIMPKAVKIMQNLYPLMNISFEIFEPRHTDHIVDSKIDYALGTTNIDGSLKHSKYVFSRRMFKDAISCGISQDALYDYDFNKELALKNHFTLYGRPYLSADRTEELDESYLSGGRVKELDGSLRLPIAGRENEPPKVISDYEYLSYLLMKQSAGIWMKSDTLYDKEITELFYFHRLKRFGIMTKSKRTNKLDKKMLEMVATK